MSGKARGLFKRTYASSSGTWTSTSYDQETLRAALDDRCPGCGGPAEVVDGWGRCLGVPHSLLVEYQICGPGDLHIHYRYQAGQLA